MKKLYIILSIVLLGIIFSSLAGCYPYDEFAPRAREIIVFAPYEPPTEPIVICEPGLPIQQPEPVIENPSGNDNTKIKYRKTTSTKTDERQSGSETKTRNLDGGRNQTSGRR